MIFFIRLSRLVTPYNIVQKSLRSFSNITQRQVRVPRVLKTIFIFRSWTPSLDYLWMVQNPF